MSKLSHLDESGAASMVDVTDKCVTAREAVAQAELRMSPETLALALSENNKKGDVLSVARIAGIQAAKKTHDLIPLCHPLMLTSIKVEFDVNQKAGRLLITTRCKLSGQTGVEMEALTAASVAALTVYDMCKAVDKGIIIGDIKLVEKRGGKSGHWKA
ncbi:MAG: cyclic pyranopterin monophosphate synthase MoaC [Pseudomonadales bacterium]|nr:cyclic pyranopterin monophosphate synthase MoaC [Pseudomonadales bacterium]